jgi:hypothetical protein
VDVDVDVDVDGRTEVGPGWWSGIVCRSVRPTRITGMIRKPSCASAGISAD